MSESLPTVYLARHGETAWSPTGQYTRLTDLLLTEAVSASPGSSVSVSRKKRQQSKLIASEKGYYDEHKTCGTPGESNSYKIRNRRTNPNGTPAYFKAHPAVRLWPGSVLWNG